MPCGDNGELEYWKSLNRRKAMNEKDDFAIKYGNLTNLLCKACKILTPAQMLNIKHENATHTLWNWYIEHCKQDEAF